MIYLLTNTITKKKTIIVRTTGDLPIDSNQKVNDKFEYIVDDNVYAEVSTVPNNLTGDEDDIQNIIHYNFQNCEVKKIDGKDFFSAYVIYTMSN